MIAPLTGGRAWSRAETVTPSFRRTLASVFNQWMVFLVLAWAPTYRVHSASAWHWTALLALSFVIFFSVQMRLRRTDSEATWK